MRRTFLAGLTLLGSSVVTCAQSAKLIGRASAGDLPPAGYAKVLNLWPAEAPMAKGNSPDDTPRLYYYPATASGVRSAVIVMPGGGYVHEVMEKEGGIEARWLAAHGVAAFVLKYRLAPTYRYPVPMLDGTRAVRYVRSHAQEYGIDPNRIGVWGFSAGGHLAGFLATSPIVNDKKNLDLVERVDAHPDFAIFSYARLSMEPAVPRSGNLEALIGQNPRPEMIDTISIVRHVTKETSPSFIYSTTADRQVDPMNSTAYYDACKREGVPVELHIFEQGQHGTGMGQGLKGEPELEIWPVLLEHWMELHGWMRPLAIEK